MRDARLLLVDGNAVGFAAHSMNRLSSGSVETQAIFGFLGALRTLLVDHPYAKPLGFWDGKSWRKAECAEYKANREEKPEQVAVRDAYRAQRPYIARALASLGVTQARADNLEADDMIAIAVHALPSSVRATIVTGDKDLLQLVRPNVDWFDPIGRKGRVGSRRLVFEAFAEETGFPNARAFVEAKALIGDTSDNLKGVDGIGDKAAALLIAHFGTVFDAVSKIRAEGEAAIPESLSRWRKKLMEFAGQMGCTSDGIERFLRNYRLMSLEQHRIPKPVNSSTVPGRFDPAKFEELCQELQFLSILRQFDEWLRPFEIRARAKETAT